MPILNLIGTVVIKICLNAADKLLTPELFSATLAVLISCIVARLSTTGVYLTPSEDDLRAAIVRAGI